MTCASTTTRAVTSALRPRVSRRASHSRVARPTRVVSATAAGTADAVTTLDAIRARARRGALENAAPFPLLRDPETYSHVSPGVCDACANSVDARKAWVALLLGQLPSHRVNAARTLTHVGVEVLGSDFLQRYAQWEEAYARYLSAISVDDAETDAIVPLRNQGATLLEMVDEKERLLREFRLFDLFAGMKARENQIAATLFPMLAREIDAIWKPKSVGSRPRASRTSSKVSEDLFVAQPPNEETRKKRLATKTVLECCLAGNLFDAGAAAAVQGVAASTSVEDSESHSCASGGDAVRLAETFAEARRKVAREGRASANRGEAEGAVGGLDALDALDALDGLEAFAARAVSRPWRRVVLFCDNAGADVMGMALLARTLAGLGGEGTKVALASNEWAALNDVTAGETRAFLRKIAFGDDFGDFPDASLGAQIEGGRVTCVSSGQISTLLDLNRCGTELNDWVSHELLTVPAGDEWLLVLDGMGRSLESNWNVAEHVSRKVNTLNLAMVKSQINAERLGANVYDCVVRLGEGK